VEVLDNRIINLILYVLWGGIATLAAGAVIYFWDIDFFDIRPGLEWLGYLVLWAIFTFAVAIVSGGPSNGGGGNGGV
jgi:hypothetical protein